MRFAVALAVALTAAPVRADQRTQRLLERLAEEASAFEHTAPNLIAEETLRQRALPLQKRRFRPRLRAAGSQPVPAPQFQTREIRSEYAFAFVGHPPVMREIRRMLEVDGKTIDSSERALQELMRSLQSNDDRSRRKLLEDFESHGLIGTATDFGPLLMLFARRNQEVYAFAPADDRLLGAEPCTVFSFRQLDGPGAVTIYGSKGRVQPSAEGEIWVSRENYRVLRITLHSVRKEESSTIREEAEVNYEMSSHGVVVPVSVIHREYRNGQLAVENRFSYSAFRRFGSSADIQFQVPGGLR